MASVVELLCPQDFLAADDDQQLVVGQPQHLVWRKQPASAKALRISVLGDDLPDLFLLYAQVGHRLDI